MKKSYEKAYLNIKNQKILAEQKINFFKSPKIVIAGMTKKIEAVYVEKPITYILEKHCNSSLRAVILPYAF